MSNSKFLNTISIAAGIIILFLLIENDKKNRKIKELQKVIDENDNLTNEVKVQLYELINNNQEIEPKIANELSQIAALLEIKQDTSAVLKLAKIIENLLKELFKNDEKLIELVKKNKRRRPVFSDYIEHGRNENVISKEEYHLLEVLKIIRNEEAHELDVKKEKSRVFASFIAGIGIILGLCKRLNRKSI